MTENNYGETEADGTRDGAARSDIQPQPTQGEIGDAAQVPPDDVMGEPGEPTPDVMRDHRASQPAADVMGEPAQPAPDVMGSRLPDADEAWGEEPRRTDS